VKFKTTIEISPSTPAATRNKIRARWDRIVRKRREKEQCNRTGEKTRTATTMHVIGINDEEIREAIKNGTIASTVADSGATSSIGTEDDPSKRTGRPSTKEFILPNGEVIPAKEIAEYPFEVRRPAKELHITPGISENSLLSTAKYEDAGYITIFDKDRVNVYDAHNTMITVSREAVLRGWRERGENLW
jgi:hypothetical protein